MAEEQKDTARNLQTAGQKSKLSQVSETGTPTTPGGGPTPTAPTRRMNEPSRGPAGDVAAASRTEAKLGENTGHASSHSTIAQGTSSSGDVVETEHDFTHEPVAHRQQVEQGETGSGTSNENDGRARDLETGR